MDRSELHEAAVCILPGDLAPIWSPLLSPALPGYPGYGKSARKSGTAIPECIQKGVEEDTCEEPRQSCALFQGPAEIPAQPGRSHKLGNAWGPISMLPWDCTPASETSGPALP